jgi:phage repressor protein C with HTH and peptisase S24 domain
MPADVISIGTKRRAYWSLLEIAQTGRRSVPYGILLADESTGEWTQLLRDFSCFDQLDEQEFDILTELSADLELKAREMGGLRLLESLEDTLSGFFRISDRESIVYGYAEDAEAAAGRLFDEHVDSTPRKFLTHLPRYGLRAAATKFGEGMEAREEGWVRTSGKLRLSEGMFVAQVVGRSMEPLISDGDLCVFRTGVKGSRKGRYLLIEKFDETDFASRYTVKRYAREGARDESAERESPIRLEPLNPDFEAFDLTSDQFRVVAEFVQVLHP